MSETITEVAVNGVPLDPSKWMVTGGAISFNGVEVANGESITFSVTYEEDGSMAVFDATPWKFGDILQSNRYPGWRVMIVSGRLGIDLGTSTVVVRPIDPDAFHLVEEA